MKQLVVLRHAKSSGSGESLDDRGRRLNERGKADALLVGNELRRRGLGFDLVLASPAVRVRETLDRLGEGHGALPAAQLYEELYLASCPTLLSTLRRVDDHVQSVLLVGHNPGLQQLALTLVESDEPKRAVVENEFATAAAAVLRLPIGAWGELAAGFATLLNLILPSEISP